MISRVESAAATRRALVDAAAELLDEGGPSAVTLREVGARAGVSRGAPYKHFVDKESLLSAVAIEAWERVIAGQRALRADAGLAPVDRLRASLTALITVGRQQPHLFQQMFTIPSGDPAAVARVAQRSQDEFLAMVAAVVGERDARRYGALLLAGAHGVTAMEVSGHLSTDKWRITAEELVAHLVELVATTVPEAERTT